MCLIAGVDGCKAGWIVLLRNLTTSTWETRLCGSFIDVVNLRPEPDVITVDMPIGLLRTPIVGGRLCDQVARELLGWPRRNSVFSPPSRLALQRDSFSEAKRLNYPAGLTIQAFCLFPKMSEVDAAMTRARQDQVFEVHPELCFYAANNKRPMQHSKKSNQGRQERLDVLGQHCGPQWKTWLQSTIATSDPKRVAVDDILDACIAALTAERIHRKAAVRIPSNPPTDSKGLRMEMWY